MDMKNLKTFHLIVKYGSFIRAAEEMNYAQSTVTMQMQRLESELGVELLERGKTIVLTEAGRLFYEQSLQIMNRLEQLQSNLGGYSVGRSGACPPRRDRADGQLPFAQIVRPIPSHLSKNKAVR